MRRASLPKPVRDGLAIGALILVIAALVGFAGAPRVLALSAPTPDLVAVSSTSDDRAPLDDADPELPPMAVGLAATSGRGGPDSGHLVRCLWR
jgi:hypothetical protein